MKKLFFFLVICLSSIIAFAQKNFQGKVVYKFLHPFAKESSIMDVYFGKKKIRVKENGRSDQIIDLQNGIVYHIDTIASSYRIDSLNNSSTGTVPRINMSKEKNKPILNYPSTAYSEINAGEKLNVTFWYADSLYFPFDTAHLRYEMLPMFGNGKTIFMGMQMSIGEATNDNNFFITPVSIEPCALPDSVFVIPAGCSLQLTEQATDSLRLTDSIMMAAMSIADSTKKTPGRRPEIKKYAKKTFFKKSPVQNTAKQPVKTAATKPKE